MTIGTPIVDIDPAFGVTEIGGKISSFEERISAQIFSQAISGDRPVLTPSYLGHPAITVDTDTFLEAEATTTGGTGAGSLTTLTVAIVKSSTASRYMMSKAEAKYSNMQGFAHVMRGNHRPVSHIGDGDGGGRDQWEGNTITDFTVPLFFIQRFNDPTRVHNFDVNGASGEITKLITDLLFNQIEDESEPMRIGDNDVGLSGDCDILRQIVWDGFEDATEIYNFYSNIYLNNAPVFGGGVRNRSALIRGVRI